MACFVPFSSVMAVKVCYAMVRRVRLCSDLAVKAVYGAFVRALARQALAVMARYVTFS